MQDKIVLLSTSETYARLTFEKKEVQHSSDNLKFLRKSHISQLSRANHFPNVG